MTTTVERHRRDKPIRRKAEAAIGLPVVGILQKAAFRRSKLEGPKRIFLPGCGIPVNYYEREATTTRGGGNDDDGDDDPPTLLLLHGLSGNVHEMTVLVSDLRIGDDVRILIPEHIGHGTDLERAAAAASASDASNYEQPTPDDLVRSTIEFLEIVRAGSNVRAFGASLGGAVLYYLRVRKPEAVRRSVLYAPALPCLLADRFLTGLREGRHELFEFGSREDVKMCFRSFFWIDPTTDSTTTIAKKKKKKKDPIPKVFYEVIYRMSLRDVPRGHFRDLQKSLLLSVDEDLLAGDDDGNGDDEPSSVYAATTDLDPNGDRLVFWADQDQICDHEKGRRFFVGDDDDDDRRRRRSRRTEFVTIPDTGHVFDIDGIGMYKLLAPKMRDYLLGVSSPPTSSSYRESSC